MLFIILYKTHHSEVVIFSLYSIYLYTEHAFIYWYFYFAKRHSTFIESLMNEHFMQVVL